MLGGGARGLARNPRAGLLVSQARQRARQVAPTAATSRQAHAARDDVRRVPRRLRGRTRAFRGGVSAQIPKGGPVSYRQVGTSGYFFDFPAEHWKHLRTTNVIESPFATVRLRERATRGAGSRTKGLLMAFKLLDMVQLRWRHLDGAQLLPPVRAGVKFADGVQGDPTKPVTQLTHNQPREAA